MHYESVCTADEGVDDDLVYHESLCMCDEQCEIKQKPVYATDEGLDDGSASRISPRRGESRLKEAQP